MIDRSIGLCTYLDGLARGEDEGAPGEALGSFHGDRADRVLAQVLSDLEDEADLVVLDFETGENGGQLAAGELHVHDGTNHLDGEEDGRGLGRGKGEGGGVEEELE